MVLGHSYIFSPYGAATSLRNHFFALSEEDNIEFELIYRKSIIKRKIKQKYSFGKNLKRIIENWLLIDEKTFVHTRPGYLKEFIYIYLPNILYQFTRIKFYRSIRDFQPHVVHLNSIVLLPMVDQVRRISNAKIVLHVRELIDVDYVEKTYPEIAGVDKIICIDQAVKAKMERLSCLSGARLLVQINPFCPPDRSDSLVAKIFNSQCRNFAIAGIVARDKGVGFVCDAFARANLRGAKLYVIGRQNKYSLYLEKKFKHIKNIEFVGEVDNLFSRGGYFFIDCIVRGEAEFCTGRSVYESLYSGGLAILPGSSCEIGLDSELEFFKASVFTYTPRCTAALTATFLKVSAELEQANNRAAKCIAKGNHDVYAAHFRQIYW